MVIIWLCIYWCKLFVLYITWCCVTFRDNLSRVIYCALTNKFFLFAMKSLNADVRKYETWHFKSFLFRSNRGSISIFFFFIIFNWIASFYYIVSTIFILLIFLLFVNAKFCQTNIWTKNKILNLNSKLTIITIYGKLVASRRSNFEFTTKRSRPYNISL